MPRLLPLLRLLLIPAAALSLAAQADTVKVLTAGAFKQVVLAAVPAFEARTGHKVEIQNDTAGALGRRIATGEAFDVVVLTTGALQPLGASGRVAANSIVPLGKVGIGVAVKAGAPEPKIDTEEAFKQALLGARKVAYIDPTSGGSSGIYLDGLFQRMGIADAIRAKAVLVPGGLVAERLVTGEADLAVHQVSEILPVQGVSFVGPLPEAVQNYTVYAGGVAGDAAHAAAAREFLASLAAPERVETLRAKGMMAP
ncbi:substrate-binding domain-containing protein [Variovorax ginsengisoli]|uniref:Molybdate transport system substrate-binding protein n=1 Tax=Variovorax ginsengisoli TaxID=363844 RepID=A0ABT9SH21_9BURK|nr:substrate-binding domain-containing protein [Variovorax ginsengisoli]MDP9902692.1 molybdate transport system substrate-binding protein [Variovorax ginsengisoli]